MNLKQNNAIILKVMMIYLTGANASLAKSADNPQSDVNRSLGGYISSTPVPNAAINSLFDLISSYTLEKRQKETIAIGLINQLDKAVKDVELKIVTDPDNEATFKIAAVSVGSNYLMEQIANRYQEPMSSEFYDASFYRAAVDIEITQYASEGEEIALYPFNVVVEVLKTGIEGTWEAFEGAFSNDETYTVKRITETKFRIERRDETVLESTIQCSYITTEGFTATFLGDLKNKADNTVLISDDFQPKQAIGIWIQRVMKKTQYPSNDELLQEFKDKYIRATIEEVEMIISYNLSDEQPNYQEAQYDEQYS